MTEVVAQVVFTQDGAVTFSTTVTCDEVDS